MWEKNGRARQVLGDNITRRTRIASWDTTATDVFSECVIGLLTAVPRQKLLRERVSILRSYVHCL